MQTLPSRETFGERVFRHGHAARPYSPTYLSWLAMKARCLCVTNPGYPMYGGRGIGVCDDWLKFENFLSDMGERPSRRFSLDRIDGSKGYELANCRWATHSEQCLNRITTRAVMCSDGRKFPSIKEAAEAVGGNRTCIRDVCTGRQKTHLGLTWSFTP